MRSGKVTSIRGKRQSKQEKVGSQGERKTAALSPHSRSNHSLYFYPARTTHMFKSIRARSALLEGMHRSESSMLRNHVRQTFWSGMQISSKSHPIRTTLKYFNPLRRSHKPRNDVMRNSRSPPRVTSTRSRGDNGALSILLSI
jgi:hypothetical protein